MAHPPSPAVLTFFFVTFFSGTALLAEYKVSNRSVPQERGKHRIYVFTQFAAHFFYLECWL